MRSAGHSTPTTARRWTRAQPRKKSVHRRGRPNASESTAPAEGTQGVGGLRSSDEVGERVASDPTERRRPARIRTLGGEHGRRIDAGTPVTGTFKGSGTS